MFAPASRTKQPLSLRTLFPWASFVDCADIVVTSVAADSRVCRPGVTFAAIPGHKCNGHLFTAEAVAKGANSILTQRPLADVSVPQCVVPNVRRAYALLNAALHDNPSRRLQTAAVTGTNGKTTVTWLIRSILNETKQSCGLLGSIEYSDGFRAEEAQLTTPNAETLNAWLSDSAKFGARYAAMEVSSHALDQDRIAGTAFDVAAVTNLTQDHFDYHGDFEHYRKAKSRIASYLKPQGRLVLNQDDAAVRTFAADHDGPVTTFGFTDEADVRAEILDETLRGTAFTLHIGTESTEVRTSLIGRHNVANCLTAAACASHFGITLKDIAHGIAALHSVPGRLERIDCRQPFAAFVDYAHTDDALQRSVDTLKQLTAGRVICVFGAGGDRDRTKRPLLGRAGSTADLAVVTSDNPRSEDPHQIIEDILRGIPAHRNIHVESHREDAIRWAVKQAEPGDCVLVAGKGHETVQIVGAERMPFDDRHVLRQAIIDQSHTPVPIPQRLPA